MKNKARIIAAGGTFLCAVGIGFFMQQTAGAPQASAPAEAVSRADFKPLSEPAFGVATSLPEARTDEIISADALVGAAPVTSDTLHVAALDEELLPSDTTEQESAAPTCDISAKASPVAGAMVRFQVDAPCFHNERAVVHHSGMMFSAATDSEGKIDLTVPALTEDAVVIVEFADGSGAVASARVPSLLFYDRVVLQWTGDLGFALHAREFDADYGTEGHVWAGSPRDVTAAALGEGGFVTMLGSSDSLAPRFAQVYTFPSGTSSGSGTIALSVEAEVTAENCDTTIEAQSLEVKAADQLRTQYLTLAVPACDAIGDFLVLNNLVDDLKIAAN